MKASRKLRRENRISATLRILLVVVLLVLHILAVGMLSIFLKTNSAVIYLLLEVAGVIAAINIQSRDTSSSYKLAWTLLVVSLPVTGLILYLLWGGRIQDKRPKIRTELPAPDSSVDSRISKDNLVRLTTAMPHWKRTAVLLGKRNFHLFGGTDTTYFDSGKAFFADVVERMARAERFIFLEFFILAEGRLWEELLTVLEERAAQGVEIKIIFDDFGSITRMSREMIARMRTAGIEVAIFNPVHQYVNRLYFNYRDHRKIIVIDGQYAYTGGVNIADEYVGYIRRFGEWKDCGILLDGMGAMGLTVRFIHMWEMMGNRLLNEYDYYRPSEERRGAGWCQTFADGPINNPDNPAEDIFLQCIYNARESIWITTPYFVVEEGMIRALCMAADSGVDVRILMPGIPDHKYTDIVAGSYYEKLLTHGVKLYRFKAGFLHSKLLLVDDEVAMVGTVNMDYRSFQLHYECGVMLYGMNTLQDIRRDITRVMERCEQIEWDVWRRRPWHRRMLERVLKIFSIWM